MVFWLVAHPFGFCNLCFFPRFFSGLDLPFFPSLGCFLGILLSLLLAVPKISPGAFCGLSGAFGIFRWFFWEILLGFAGFGFHRAGAIKLSLGLTFGLHIQNANWAVSIDPFYSQSWQAAVPFAGWLDLRATGGTYLPSPHCRDQNNLTELVFSV